MTAEAAAAVLIAMVRTKSTISAPIGMNALGSPNAWAAAVWRFYLAYSEAGFASGYLDEHQIVLDRKVPS